MPNRGAGGGRRRQEGQKAPSCLLLPLSAALLFSACARGEGQRDLDTPLQAGMIRQSLLGETLIVPEGFRVSVFADRLDGVRFMTLGPAGDVYVTQPGAGRVVRLPDHDRNGVADSVRPVHQGLSFPHGLAFRGDSLYVAETGRVVRFDPGKVAPVVLVADLPAGGGHSTRTIVFRDDEMFVSVGSSCNLCDERDRRRAAVIRYRLDGSAESLFATGLRNSVGLAVHPETGEIWATNNDRDNLGDDVPPDRINVLRPGGFYGWPACYLPGKANPEYARQASSCGQAIGPAVELPAHSAPLGLVFYTGSMFPEAYRGNVFVALHGSWNRSEPIGYKVVRVEVRNGQPVGRWTDFVAGWLKPRGPWGRPVDLLVLPDGSMLISDDEGGRIYRVVYAGKAVGR